MVRLGRKGLALTKPDQTSISITCPQGLRGGGREHTQLVIADVECCNEHCQTPNAFYLLLGGHRKGGRKKYRYTHLSVPLHGNL